MRQRARGAAAAGGRRRLLFWRLLASYFLLILLPVLAASFITYGIAIAVIETQAAESHVASMATVARAVDLNLEAVERRAIALLASSAVERLMRFPADRAARSWVWSSAPVETLADLQAELRALLTSENLVAGAYLYFVDAGVVVSDTYVGGAAYFFDYENSYASQPPGWWRSLLSSQCLSSFGAAEQVERREPVDGRLWKRQVVVPVVSSYPFHGVPRAFLVVHVGQKALERSIEPAGGPSTAATIVDAQGRLIARRGELEVEPASAPAGGPCGSETVTLAGRRVQAAYVRSSQNDWIYVSYADVEALHAPAAGIRAWSAAFVALFLVVGLAASWWLSLRLYRPIHAIRTDLERTLPESRAPDAQQAAATASRVDDLAVIRAWSQSLATRNRELQDRVQDIKPFIQESMLNRLLTRQVGSSALEEYGKLLGLEIPLDGPKAVLCVEYRFHPEVRVRFSEMERLLEVLELRNEIRGAVGVASWIGEPAKGTIACLLDLSAGGTALRQAAERTLGVLKGHREWLSSAVGVGTVETNALDLWRSYERAASRLLARRLVVEPQVLWEDEQPSGDAFLVAEEVASLQEVISLGDRDALRDAASNLLLRHAAMSPPAALVLGFAHDLLNTLTRLASERGFGDPAIRAHADLAEGIERATRVADILAVFARFCDLVPLRSAHRPDRAAVLEEAKAYIETHFAELMTIDQLAERCRMSPGHFSRCFKDHVGEKYVDFVNRIRVERAKELLRASDDRLEIVARSVGYPADKSFIVIFKKHVGLTPGQYRAAVRRSTAASAQ
jgi:two-component system, response regulator YesN